MTNLIIPGGTYRHYKGGLYRVLHLALAESDRCELVVYQAVPAQSPPTLWVRPAVEWVQAVEGGGKRFELVAGPEEW